MNPDDYIEGTFDSRNPANEKETEAFQSEDLQECLDYYKDTGDSVPLETAIFNTEIAKKRAVKDLTEVIKLERSKGFNATANFICTIKDLLK